MNKFVRIFLFVALAAGIVLFAVNFRSLQKVFTERMVTTPAAQPSASVEVPDEPLVTRASVTEAEITKNPEAVQMWDKAAELIDLKIKAFLHQSRARTASVAIMDPVTRSTIMYNAYERYPGASIPKIYIMLGVYEKVERMQALVNDMSNRRSEYLEEISGLNILLTNIAAGNENIQQLKHRISAANSAAASLGANIRRVSEYIQRLDSFVVPMIVHSDNGALHWFRGHFGDDFFQEYIDKLNLRDTQWNSKKRHTTPGDVCTTFFHIYNRNLFSNPYYNDRMVNLLKRVDRSGLGLKIPAEIPIAQKRGLWDGHFTERHGAGIVYTEKGDFIAVIFTKSTSSDYDPGSIPQGTQLLADVTSIVYETLYK